MAQNGDGVRITRATLALIIAVCAPIATGAVAEYRLRTAEAVVADHESRVRQIEIAITRMEQNSEALSEQSAQIEELRKEVRELTRQLDRTP